MVIGEDGIDGCGPCGAETAGLKNSHLNLLGHTRHPRHAGHTAAKPQVTALPTDLSGTLVLPDDAGVASVAERHTRGTDVYASQRRTGSNLVDLGRRRRAPVSLITEAGNSLKCRRD